MKNVVVFGTGRHYENHERLMDKEWNIVAFADNNIDKQGKSFRGKPVINPNELMKTDQYDYIVVASVAKDEIIRQILGMQIAIEKICLLNCFRLVDPAKVSAQVMPCGDVVYKVNEIVFKCTSRSDFNVAQDVFDIGFYNYVDNSDNNLIVIDIGMNIGLASLFFASKERVTKVYGFEPFIDTYKQSLDNIRENDKLIQEKIETFAYGLGNENCTKNFIYDASFSEGLSTVGNGVEKSENTVSVIIKDATEILTPILNTSNKVVMKMDCEGSEYDILSNLHNSNLISKIDVFIIECHNPDKNATLENILKKNGYSYILIPSNKTLSILYGFRNEGKYL